MRIATGVVLLTVVVWSPVWAAGKIYEVRYPASMEPGQLQMDVTYRLWIPEDVGHVRGVIVHQHGCGEGACKGGETAADDLHWQALAAKWNCALLGPRYHQAEQQNCRLWCDPRNGSRATFLRCLNDFAEQSHHPELSTVPWCFWGHSGGGFWASLMQASDPERIVAIWLRSGSAIMAWEAGEIEKPMLSPAVYTVPVMSNPGMKERDHERFKAAWNGGWTMFESYRKQGAPFGFAPDPRTGHECGDSRYLAIPYFDACLAIRLPEPGAKDQSLKAVDRQMSWFAVPLTDQIYPAAKAPAEATVWLPSEAVAKAYAEYVITGAVSDATPPPVPEAVTVTKIDQGVSITWSAMADFESGLAGFVIERDGQVIAALPEKPIGRYGRALWQTMSYHDTPEQPLPQMSYVDTSASTAAAKYTVRSVNSVGLKSDPAQSQP